MLRMVQTGHAAAAKRYFDDGLACEDYYTPKSKKDQERTEPSAWGGKGAERLGLRGEVDRESFHCLCENLLPDGSGPLTPRTKANRRVGYDINFHCPKSVSVVYALTGDPAILACFRAAVTAAMEHLEADAKTRVRCDGAQGERTTGNLVWAEFIHTTARPVGGIPDPHLHAHCFTFNATFDVVEDRWKAGEFGTAKANGSHHEAVFHAVLASLLSEHGYEVERRGRFWELAGVMDSAIQKFSRRTAEVNRQADDLGIADPKRKAELGARTRRSKAEARPWDEIQHDWRERLEPEELASVLGAKRSDKRSTTKDATRDAVDFAIESCFDRTAWVPERRLEEEALRHGVGHVTVAGVQHELSARDFTRRTVNGETLVTTPEVQERERLLVTFAREGRGTCPRLCPADLVLDTDGLTLSQIAAVNSLVGSRDRVSLLRTAKQSVAAIARDSVERAGHKVIRLHGEAVGDFITDASRKEASRGGVLWVERAEKLGARSMLGLFDFARMLNARIVLAARLGRSGGREDRALLKLLEHDAGVRSADKQRALKERAEQRGAAKALGNGDARSGYSRLERIGRIRETPKTEIPDAVASEYAKAARDGKKARVVTPEDGESITECIRRRLREFKLLGRPRTFEKLTGAGLSARMRGCSDFYEHGQVVVFYKSVKGFKAGHRYEVMGHDPFGNVLARHLTYSTSLLPSQLPWIEALPLKKSDHFDVFRRSTIELARGDSVRISRTGRTKNERFGPEKLLSKRRQAIRLANFDMFGIKAPDRRYRVPKDSVHRVVGFTVTGHIKLDNGWVLPKHFGHLEHGYCVEPDAARKERVEHLLVVQTANGSKSSGRAWNARGLESVVVFTDDKDALHRSMGAEPRHRSMNGQTTETERPRGREERERER